MRNEIFNQIKQNRKRYYSELKTIEDEISKPEIEVVKHSDNSGDKINHVESDKSERNPNIYIPKFHFNIMPVVKLGKSATGFTVKTLKEGNTQFDKFNQSLIEHTGRMTQRFYEITSGFFEDPNDTEDYSEELNFRNSQSDLQERSGTLNFIGINQSGTMALDATYLTSLERFLLWINKQYQKIVLFLESDELTETKEVKSPKLEPKEINLDEEKSNINTSIEEIINYSENTEKRKETNTSISRLFALIFNNPLMTSVNIISTIEMVMIFGKKALIMIFPIINRFI